MKKARNALAVFESFKIRRHYDEAREIWCFSVIDIVAALTEQTDFKRAQSYWTTLKNRLKHEGNESVTKCDQLKNIEGGEVVTECDRLKVLALDVKLRTAQFHPYL